MGALVWLMIGLAIWHFTVFLPERFAGGIIGAFLGALIGSFVFGVIVNLGSIPGRSETDLLTGVEAIPGAVIGLAIVYAMGVRAERAQATGPAGLAR